jgi:hypothetical protein
MIELIPKKVLWSHFLKGGALPAIAKLNDIEVGQQEIGGKRGESRPLMGARHSPLQSMDDLRTFFYPVGWGGR